MTIHVDHAAAVRPIADKENMMPTPAAKAPSTSRAAASPAIALGDSASLTQTLDNLVGQALRLGHARDALVSEVRRAPHTPTPWLTLLRREEEERRLAEVSDRSERLARVRQLLVGYSHATKAMSDEFHAHPDYIAVWIGYARLQRCEACSSAAPMRCHRRAARALSVASAATCATPRRAQRDVRDGRAVHLQVNEERAHRRRLRRLLRRVGEL